MEQVRRDQQLDRAAHEPVAPESGELLDVPVREDDAAIGSGHDEAFRRRLQQRPGLDHRGEMGLGTGGAGRDPVAFVHHAVEPFRGCRARGIGTWGFPPEPKGATAARGTRSWVSRAWVPGIPRAPRGPMLVGWPTAWNA